MGGLDYCVTWKFKFSWSCLRILIKKGVDCTPHSKIINPLGWYITCILKAEIKDKIYVLINIYAPNKDKDSFKLFANLLGMFKK